MIVKIIFNLIFSSLFIDPRIDPVLKKQLEYAENLQSLPLPEGWEIRVDVKGVSYFVDHKNKISSYSDPRASK